MSILTYYTARKQAIIVDSTSIGRGGEGDVYRVISTSHPSSCIKIYHTKYQTKSKEAKISYMVNNPPDIIVGGLFCLCWPQQVIYNAHGAFVGFLMPLAFNQSISLYELVTIRLKSNLNPVWSQKFLRSNGEGLKNRLIICVNLSGAVARIHAKQQYVFVDLKPQNILVSPQGKVSIIDLDSIQINNQQRVLYHAQVSTFEYTPKEGSNINLSQSFIKEPWDRFSLAVIFYEILLGLHPCVGSLKAPHDNLSTIPERIPRGLYAIGSKQSAFSKIPINHSYIDLFPATIKSMFIKAFDIGTTNPQSRPTAMEWGTLLYSVVMSPEANQSRPKSNPPKPPSSPPPQPVQVKTPPVQQAKSTSYTSNQVTPNSQNNMLWLVMVVILLGILAIIYLSSNRNSSDDSYYADSSVVAVDTVAVDEVAVDTAEVMVDTVASMTQDELSVPDGTITFWQTCDSADDSIAVFVDGVEQGIIRDCSNTTPRRYSSGFVTFTGKRFHKYFIQAFSSAGTWADSVEIGMAGNNYFELQK